MPDAEAARDWLCNAQSEVSAHYVIARDGACWQLVREEDRAWHAGAGSWGGQGDVNSRSIGIELANTGAEPFAEPQMAALEALLPGILDRWAIPPAGVIGHADMAPGRKIDPGPRFDWRRLARAGLCVWPKDREAQPDSFVTHAATFGYPVDGPVDVLLRVFRDRFRPWATGPLDATDAGLAADLAARFPFDAAGAVA